MTPFLCLDCSSVEEPCTSISRHVGQPCDASNSKTPDSILLSSPRLVVFAVVFGGKWIITERSLWLENFRIEKNLSLVLSSRNTSPNACCFHGHIDKVREHRSVVTIVRASSYTSPPELPCKMRKTPSLTIAVVSRQC